jgi:hypothetical protein
VSFNDATLIVYLSTWGILIAWEIVTLVRRWKYPGTGQKTISMVLRDNGHRLPVVVFSSTGMPAHWWWNAEAWGPAWLGLTYWIITVLLLAWGIWEWPRNAPKRWFRSPVLWMVAGALAGRFLFPQKASP